MKKKIHKKIWLSSPHMGGSEQKYIQEAFDTNWIAPLGPNVDAFEKSLEKYVGEHKKVAAVSSGTAAIHLALILAGVTKGDEVLCQSFTYSATRSARPCRAQLPNEPQNATNAWNMCPV